jgi:Fe-S-cluster containining protein
MNDELKAFLRKVNQADISIRPCMFVQHFNMQRLDDHTRMFMTTSNVVIPGESTYECTKCGYCCSNEHIKLPKEFVRDDGKGCKHLVNNLCSIDDAKSHICKQFPFRVLKFRTKDSVLKLLCISVHCRGQVIGGPIIDDINYEKLLEICSRAPEDIVQTRNFNEV